MKFYENFDRKIVDYFENANFYSKISLIMSLEDKYIKEDLEL